MKQALKRYAKNIRGWRTDRKILVFESDDWGSIRMPSREIYDKCLNEGYRVDQNPYERFDSLASEEDLGKLFDLLLSFKDSGGSPPVITANSLIANPDFDKIRESEFREYHYERVTDTLKRYPAHSNCFNLWMKGKENGIFFPQAHGREHLNVSEWMNALKNGKEEALFGFENEMPGCILKNSKKGNRYVEAMRYSSEEDKAEKLSIILEGLKLFEEIFGYRSESFIPPNYIWNPEFNKALSEAGVRYLQGQRKLKEPVPDGSVKFHSGYMGKKVEGLIRLVRNAVFEPTLNQNSSADPVERCLSDISAAFMMKKPAIITCHRINFVGFIDAQNRDRNLRRMEKLLQEILKRWPDVEFLNSVQLGKRIAGDTG